MKLISVLRLSLAPILLGLLFSFKMVPPTEPANEIEWLTWEQAIEKLENGDKKKIFIDVYTDWCGWCKQMDKSTFQHPEIAKYMKENFHAVKLDAEGKDDIVFRDHTFKYVAQGRRGYHELAASLLQGRMSYPTVVFLDEEANLISPVPGYQPAESFHKILTYFAEEHYKDTEWQEFEKTYKAPEGLK